MSKIISINQPRAFTLSDAHSLLPVIYRITEVAHAEVKGLINRMEAVKSSNSVLAQKIEIEIDLEVSRWEQKVEKLGATPKGLWLADFDNGEGYYCWKFPENEIRYWHGYSEGFSNRKELKLKNDSQQNYREILHET
jgi:hypothetical protein